MNGKILILLFIAIPLIYCCCENKDIIPPPQGAEYKGTYQVDINPGTDSSIMIIQYVVWTFSDFRFFCLIDTTKSEKIICDFSGNYHVENDSINFEDLLISPGGCDSNLVARGKFELSINHNLLNLDILRFYQRVDGQDGIAVKTIILVKSYY